LYSNSGLRLEYSWVRNCRAYSSSISSRLGTRWSSMKRSSFRGHRSWCSAMLPSIEPLCICRRLGQGSYAPALVRCVVLTVRVRHPPHAMPHSGGALPSLSTRAIPSPEEEYNVRHVQRGVDPTQGTGKRERRNSGAGASCAAPVTRGFSRLHVLVDARCHP
jgi:hypothetical protein